MRNRSFSHKSIVLPNTIMTASQADLDLAAASCPESVILSVTAAPKIRNEAPVYVHYAAMACWTHQGRIKKRLYHQGRSVGLTIFLKNTCLDKSNKWDMNLMTPVSSS